MPPLALTSAATGSIAAVSRLTLTTRPPEAEVGFKLTVDLERQVVLTGDGSEFSFEVPGFRKFCLLNGFDDIALTLRHADKIKQFENERLVKQPWLNNRLVG